MTIHPAPFKSEFLNQYGDSWIFEYDYTRERATLTGQDVAWEVFPVIEGEPFELLLNTEERAWLMTAWWEATRGTSVGKVYGACDTSFEQGKKACGLTNSYCPICLCRKTDFHDHHCIPKANGGTDDPCNVLSICSTCHLAITAGDPSDQIPKSRAASLHQLMRFGPDYTVRAISALPTGSQFMKSQPFIRYFTEVVAPKLRGMKGDDLGRFKRDARIRYKYFRDMALGKWSWERQKKREDREDQKLAELGCAPLDPWYWLNLAKPNDA